MKKVKHFYVTKAPYFVTTQPISRYPFFEEDIFCNILLDVFEECSKKKSFHLIGIKINPDHCHIIIQPIGDYNISQIMQSVKRISSDRINQIICYLNEENPYEKLVWTPELIQYRRQFLRKYNQEMTDFPLFKWERSFHGKRPIPTEAEFYGKIKYLKRQWEHHDLPVNKFLYINAKIPNDLVFISKN